MLWWIALEKAWASKKKILRKDKPFIIRAKISLLKGIKNVKRWTGNLINAEEEINDRKIEVSCKQEVDKKKR